MRKKIILKEQTRKCSLSYYFFFPFSFYVSIRLSISLYIYLSLLRKSHVDFDR